MDISTLNKLATLARYYILTSTTKAGSGHPTSSLSAVELMVALMFGGVFRSDVDNPESPRNDRLIFSKGHASPLFYALWAIAGKLTAEELLNLRKFKSPLEGHPSLRFPYTEAATGSLGQGLSIGVGMALNERLDHSGYRTYVLLGDSEISEGSVWEAIQIAAHYKLDNLVGVLDVNRLGQRGQTMYGHDLEAYAKRVRAFGWKTIIVHDGHSFDEVLAAYAASKRVYGSPTMIIAKTLKGKGVSFIEDKEGWHGKPLSVDELQKALAELGKVDTMMRGDIPKPEPTEISNSQFLISNQTPNPNVQIEYPPDKPAATRKAYGNALGRLGATVPNMVVLDAEVSNSTFAEVFKKEYPERFFEMFIAEQNMVGVALGLARRGKLPFVSSFAAFLTRAFDQIRMSQYSGAHLVFCGSHAGVSIGEDGPSQMGLEDIAMFRALLGSVVFYPSDAISTERLVEASCNQPGITYIRTSRPATPILYNADEEFHIGGSKVLRESEKDTVTVIGAGVTLFEALAAYEELKKEEVTIRVIDLYSVKPLDYTTLGRAAKETRAIITVEDHFAEGGLGEAVASAVSQMPDIKCEVIQLAVRKMPRSATAQELLDYTEISKHAIVRKIKEFI